MAGAIVRAALAQMTAAAHRTPKDEKELQARITQAAKQLGWRVTHYPYGIGADRGYSDPTLVHGSYISI
jgi:Xaa-Pro aminopeptidase